MVPSQVKIILMLEADQLEIARSRLASLERALTLEVYPGLEPTDPFAVAQREVLNQLSSVSGGMLHLEEVGESAFSEDPCFSVGNMRFLAVPEGRELAPMLEILVALSAHTPEAGASDSTLAPALVELYIAPTCPNCAAVVAECGKALCGLEQVHLVVIDVMHFQRRAGALKSVPAVIIDRTRTVIGELSGEELIRMLEERGEPTYLQKSMISMIEAGRLAEAEQLLTSDEGLRALAELMSAGEMQQRMGLMVLAEEVLEDDPHCLDGALPTLLPLLEVEDPTVRGDVADLLGKIGAPGAREGLERLLADENPDVRDIAAESLAMLRRPS
jgi:hypothetical protein